MPTERHIEQALEDLKSLGLMDAIDSKIPLDRQGSDLSLARLYLDLRDTALAFRGQLKEALATHGCRKILRLRIQALLLDLDHKKEEEYWIGWQEDHKRMAKVQGLEELEDILSLTQDLVKAIVTALERTKGESFYSGTLFAAQIGGGDVEEDVPLLVQLKRTHPSDWERTSMRTDLRLSL